jgi:NAD(P)-dependent dehydrogenase (short-subunit alcohol dehydrogenase family)
VVDLVAPAMLFYAVLPGMIWRGGGRIVNIGSVFGAIPSAHFASFSLFEEKGGAETPLVSRARRPVIASPPRSFT